MAFLTLPTFGDVPVEIGSDGAVRDNAEVGGRARMLDGTMHSSVRDSKGGWRIRTTPILRASGDSLVAVLTGTQPLSCSGDLLGGSVTCHAELGQVRHVKTADGERQIVEFTLHEE